MSAIVRPLQTLALALLAALAGFFYAYWCSVMPGLAVATPEMGATAMQAINRVVRNWAFAPAFFGPLLATPLAAFASWRAGSRPAAAWLLAAFLAHLCAVMVTMAFNVPLNEGLAAAPADAQATRALWGAYLADWGFWNALRMTISFLALIFAALAMTRGVDKSLAKSALPS